MRATIDLSTGRVLLVPKINTIIVDPGPDRADPLTGNTALGVEVLRSADKSALDLTLGEPPLTFLANTTGGENVGTGTQALKNLRYGSDNTAVGARAMRDNTDGYYNTGVGHYALGFNALGIRNTAMGAFCMQGVESSTLCHDNVAMGHRALAIIDQGRWNTAIGTHSLLTLADGTFNTAIGGSTLANCDGDYNTALGSGTLNDVTTGDKNTAVGNQAGRGVTTGSGNTIVGSNIGGLSSGLTNNILIGNGSGADDTAGVKAWHNGNNWTLSDFGLKVTTKTANYTAADESVILCDATSGAITITLPAAANSANRVYNVKKTDSSANAVTIDGNLSETIDGAATVAISVQYQTLTVVCDGSNWWLI